MMTVEPSFCRSATWFFVGLDHEERRSYRGHLAADVLADPAVAYENHVIGQRRDGEGLACGVSGRFLCCGRFLLGGDSVCLRRRLAVSPLREPPVQQGEQERIDQDRQDRAGEDQVAPLLRQDLKLDAEAGENERELADLREACRNGQRGRVRVAEEPDDGEGRQRLADDDDQEGRNAPGRNR